MLKLWREELRYPSCERYNSCRAAEAAFLVNSIASVPRVSLVEN